MNVFHCLEIFRRFSFMEILVFLILSIVLLLMTGNRFLQSKSECNITKRQAVLSDSLNSVMLHNLCEMGEEVQYVWLEQLDNGLNVNAWYYNTDSKRLTHLYNSDMDKQKPRLTTQYLKRARLPLSVTQIKGLNGFVHEVQVPFQVFGDSYPRVHLYGGRFTQILNDKEWKNSGRPYRAITAGPLIDAKVETVFFPGVTPEPTITFYDPSNGVSSHGYLIQTAEGFRAQNIATAKKPLITARLK